MLVDQWAGARVAGKVENLADLMVVAKDAM